MLLLLGGVVLCYLEVVLEEDINSGSQHEKIILFHFGIVAIKEHVEKTLYMIFFTLFNSDSVKTLYGIRNWKLVFGIRLVIWYNRTKKYKINKDLMNKETVFI